MIKTRQKAEQQICKFTHTSLEAKTIMPKRNIWAAKTARAAEKARRRVCVQVQRWDHWTPASQIISPTKPGRPQSSYSITTRNEPNSMEAGTSRVRRKSGWRRRRAAGRRRRAAGFHSFRPQKKQLHSNVPEPETLNFSATKLNKHKPNCC